MIYNRLLQGLLLTFAVLSLTPEIAAAFNFTPTKSEFRMMPPYCQARYATTMPGRAGGFTAPGAGKWIQVIGKKSYRHLHHYCAGNVWLKRASQTTNQQKRTFQLQRAVSEMDYTYSRIKPNTIIYAKVAGDLALAYDQAKKAGKASAVINRLLNTKPTDYRAYISGAKLYKQRRDLDRAIAILKQGEKRAKEKKMIYLFLARLNLKKKSYEEARKYARLAKKHGKQSKSLNRKLEKAGFPL